MIIKSSARLLSFLLLLISAAASFAQTLGRYNAIYSGLPWFDDRGKVVSAHGANIVKDKGRFYLFGEAHSDTSNAFAGFNCYSSADLYNWKFERIALAVQDTGKLGANSVGERPKVMKCPKTGDYVLFMHADSLGYTKQFIGYATSKNISGPYTFKGALLFNGKPIRKWDMGTFQDTDGSGYVLIHGGEIYKLSDDYTSAGEQVNKSMTSGFESPDIVKKDGTYYFLGSDLTSWEKNDNYYFTASSLKGPWTNRGPFAPKGTLTWNSQTSFVLPIEGTKGTTFMFMGDRWSFPKQALAATYIWQPLTISGFSISIPTYQEAWRVSVQTGLVSPASFEGKVIDNSDKGVKFNGNWQQTSAGGTTLSTADEKGASFSVAFIGTQVAFYGLSGPDRGYARVLIADKKGRTVSTAVVDMYCKYPLDELKFLSPLLPKGSYTLTVTAMGERPNWTDKKKTLYGSTGYAVALDKIVVKE